MAGLVTTLWALASLRADADSLPSFCIVPEAATIASVEQIDQALTSAGCTRGQLQRVRSSLPRNIVISVAPSAGTQLDLGSAVDLIVSDGRCFIDKPVRGLSAKALRRRLRSSGCRAGIITANYSQTVRFGHVIRIRAHIGEERHWNAPVSAVISKGPKPFPFANSMVKARSYAATRRGNVGWGVIDTNARLHHYNGHRLFRTASVVKAMILVARLQQHSEKKLSSSTRADLGIMIRYSDNEAASRQYHAVCAKRLKRLAIRAQMNDIVIPSSCNWGTVHFSAIDQARLFYRIDQLMPARHREFGMNLLRTVTPSQRWGVAAAADHLAPQWRVAFKGGWLPRSCGSIEHQAAQFVREQKRWSLAVLTDCNPGASYGRATQYGVARRLIR